MSFPKSEFIDWRTMPLTQALYKAVREQAEGLASEIINRVDENPKRDNFCKGNISMAEQVLRWQPEFTIEVMIDEDGNLVEKPEVSNED